MHVVRICSAFSMRGPEGAGFVGVDAFLWGGIGDGLGGARGVVGGALLASGRVGCQREGVEEEDAEEMS